MLDNTTDFHYMSLDDAVTLIHEIIGNIRLKKDPILYYFVVGHGEIRKELLIILESYDLKGSARLGNPGIIVSLIE